MQTLKTINEHNFISSTTEPNRPADKLGFVKALLIEEINQAVLELSLIKEGKKEARDAEDFLNEL